MGFSGPQLAPNLYPSCECKLGALTMIINELLRGFIVLVTIYSLDSFKLENRGKDIEEYPFNRIYETALGGA